MADIINIEMPPGYEYSLPDLSDLSSRSRIVQGGDSLGEQWARSQTAAANPRVPDLSQALRQPPSSAASLAERYAQLENGLTTRGTAAARPATIAPVLDLPKAPPPRPISAPAPIEVAPTGGVMAGVSRIAGAVGVVQNLSDLSVAVGNLPIQAENIGRAARGEPTLPVNDTSYDRILDQLSDPRDRITGLTPAETLRRIRDGEALPQSPVVGLLAPVTCSLFGIGCTDNTEGVPHSGGSAPAPPFYGGQSEGVMYTVTTQSRQTNEFGYEAGGQDVKQVRGRILGTRTENGNNFIRSSTAGDVFVNFLNPIFFYQGQPRNYVISFGISNIIRTDGQPDTGGNPAPAPGTPNRPATAPVVGNRLQIDQPPNYNRSLPVSPTAPGSPTAPPATAPNPVAQPVTTAPGNPPPANPLIPANPPAQPTEDEDSPANPLSPFLPLSTLPFIPAIARSNSGLNRQSAANRTGATPPTSTTTTSTNFSCSYDSRNISGKVDDANTTLNLVNQFLTTQMMQKLDKIDAKLGPQIPTGGISGTLTRAFELGKKTWNFLQVDRVLSVLTWIGVLHNAYMLSNGLAQTLFSAISNTLDVFGIEDAEGNALNVGEIVGKWTDAFFKRIFGVETVDGFKAAWKRFNRIYQAAANIIYSLQSITFSMVEILETISNYVGKIGNALRKAGVVLENSFNWMNPNANYTNNRFFNALNNTQEAVEAIDQVASEVLSIQQTSAELFDQKEEFETAMNEATRTIEETEGAAKGRSTQPLLTITPNDEKKATTE